MEFDKYNIPSSPHFSSLFVEGKVKEDIKLLNVITENYRFQCITEDAALALIDIVRKEEGNLLDELEIYESFSDLEVPVSDRILYMGERVIPFANIVTESDDLCIYRPYTFEREWENENGLVYEMATITADEKMDGLAEYIESNGTSGFDSETRSVYSTIPERVDRLYLFEKVLDGKVLAGNLSPEDGSIAKGLVDYMFAENDVAAMSPVTTTNQPTITKNAPNMKETFKKDLEYMKKDKSSDKDEADLKTLKGVFEYVSGMLRNNNFFVYLEEAKAEENPLLDKDARKLFMTIMKMVKVSDPKDTQKSLMNCLSSDKLTYRFNLVKDANLMTILGHVKALGYKQNQNETKKDNYILHKDVKVGIITAEIKKRYVELSWEDAEESTEESAKDDLKIKKNSQTEQLIEDCINHEDIAVRDAAKKAKKLLINSSDEAEQRKAVNAFLHIYKTYQKVQTHKAFKESGGSVSSLILKVEDAMKEERYLNEYVSDETLGAAKDLLMNAIELVSEATTESIDSMGTMINGKSGLEIPRYLVNVILESPSPHVMETATDLLTSIYNDNYTGNLRKLAKSFMEAVATQDTIEEIVEIVLNQSDFQKRYYDGYFTESDLGIDEGIKPIVEKLNNLGYKVKYSCAGHSRSHKTEDRYRDGVYKGKLYTTARITFDKHYDFSSAPDGWYFNKNADVSALYVRPYQYTEEDGTPEESFNKWKARYMRALESWVDSLKDASKTDSSKKMMNVAESFSRSVMANLPCDVDVKYDDTYEEKSISLHDIANESFRRFGI